MTHTWCMWIDQGSEVSMAWAWNRDHEVWGPGQLPVMLTAIELGDGVVRTLQEPELLSFVEASEKGMTLEVGIRACDYGTPLVNHSYERRGELSRYRMITKDGFFAFRCGVMEP